MPWIEEYKTGKNIGMVGQFLPHPVYHTSRCVTLLLYSENEHELCERERQIMVELSDQEGIKGSQHVYQVQEYESMNVSQCYVIQEWQKTLERTYSNFYKCELKQKIDGFLRQDAVSRKLIFLLVSYDGSVFTHEVKSLPMRPQNNLRIYSHAIYPVLRLMNFVVSVSSRLGIGHYNIFENTVRFVYHEKTPSYCTATLIDWSRSALARDAIHQIVTREIGPTVLYKDLPIEVVLFEIAYSMLKCLQDTESLTKQTLLHNAQSLIDAFDTNDWTSIQDCVFLDKQEDEKQKLINLYRNLPKTYCQYTNETFKKRVRLVMGTTYDGMLHSQYKNKLELKWNVIRAIFSLYSESCMICLIDVQALARILVCNIQECYRFAPAPYFMKETLPRIQYNLGKLTDTSNSHSQVHMHLEELYETINTVLPHIKQKEVEFETRQKEEQQSEIDMADLLSMFRDMTIKSQTKKNKKNFV